MQPSEINNINIKPYLPSLVAEFLESSILKSLCPGVDGPVIVLFPQIFSSNINSLKEVLSRSLEKYKIYFAHKANKQNIFPQVGKIQNIQIDVASTEELLSAFRAGFTSREIEATGPKTDSFLEVLIMHSCLISVDSVQEINRIILLLESLPSIHKVDLCLRIGKISSKSRDLRQTSSRFGIDESDLSEALEQIESNNYLNLKSIHFHAGRNSVSEKISLIPVLCDFAKYALSRGHQIEEFNLGGGYRNRILEDSNEWEKYLDQTEERILTGETLDSWNGSSYGLKLTEAGTIVGRSNAISKGTPENFNSTLESMLSKKIDDKNTLSQFLDELEISLAIEPGYFLLDQAGCTFFRVIESKISKSGNNFIVVGGNSYDLASHIRDYIPDPLLIKNSDNFNDPCSAFIVGNLCREEDALINRRIYFESCPNQGDILCFTNTAAYRSDFEVISAHLRKPTSDYIATWKDQNGDWNLSKADQLSTAQIYNIFN